MKKELTIVVPTDWSAITLRQYLELQKDLKAYEGEDEAILAVMFHHLCGVSADILPRLDTETFIKIKNDLTKFVSNTELDLVREFTHNGIEYGFYPNLSKIEYGAYLDLCKYTSTGISDDWAKVMSILYRPITKKSMGLYSVQPYKGDEETELFLDMGMDIHFGAYFFFINLSMDLLSATLNYLTTNKDIPQNIKQTLQKSGEAIQQLSL